MAIALVKMGIYNTYTDKEMYTQGGVIVDALETNVPIPQIVPLVATTSSNNKAYAEAYMEAEGRSTVAVAKKRKAKQVLADNLVRLSVAVNYFANGNAEILALTGMPMEKSRSQKMKVVLQKPAGIAAVNCGNSGCVKVSVKEAIGANSFVYQWTTEPVTDSSIWVSDGCKLRSFTWQNLTPGTLLWFRVIAIGSGGARLQSDAISCMVI